MHLGAAAYDGPVVDVGLAREAHVTHEDAVVADAAVVGDVHVRHYQGVAAHAGDSLAAGPGAAVDGGAFANVDAVAYLHPSHLSVELEVLGNSSHDGSGEHRAVAAQLYVRENGGVRQYPAAGAYLYVVFNVCVGSDLHVFCKTGSGMNGGKRVNIGHNYLIFKCLLISRAACVLSECPGLNASTRAFR